MANFVFKRTEQKTMKIAGTLDTDTMTIDIDGENKKLSTLLSPFSCCDVEINVKIKSEEDLDEPQA